MIDRIKKKVEFFINTEMRGNFTPGKFELALHDAIQSRSEEFFHELNRYVVKESRGLIVGGLSNIPDTYSEKILFYLEEEELTVLSNKVQLPENWRYLDESEILNGASLEFCRTKREFKIQKGFASLKYPIYTIIGNNLLISPIQDGQKITISYLRQPKYPKWTYTVVNGTELFNPDDAKFEDADIHPSEENEIVRRVLMSFGVNLKETDIQAFTIQEDNRDFNQDNA